MIDDHFPTVSYDLTAARTHYFAMTRPREVKFTERDLHFLNTEQDAVRHAHSYNLAWTKVTVGLCRSG